MKLRSFFLFLTFTLFAIYNTERNARGKTYHCSDHDNRILITGAAGFIGMHTAIAASKKGYAVTGIDNFNNYYPVSLKIARTKELRNHNISVITMDLNDAASVNLLFETCRFKHVIHLAAQAGVRYAKSHPITYIDSNIKGTVILYEAIKNTIIPPTVIYASSSSVYGKSTDTPFSESTVPMPASLYAASKLAVEYISDVYTNLYGLKMIGLRFFTVYGPWGRPDMSLMAFTRELMRNGTLIIYTDRHGGDLSRDFTYVDDTVSGILACLVKKDLAMHHIYNIGGNKPIQVLHVVKVLSELTGRAANILYRRSSMDEALFTHANISLASKDLAYAPSIQFDEGLRHFITWYRSYYGERGIDGEMKVALDERKYLPLQ